MMNITVKYFASLREQLGKNEEVLSFDDTLSVLDIWENISAKTAADNVLMAVNMEYAQPDTLVKDGDEVAFFPPVTGG